MKGVKLTRKISLFLGEFCLTEQDILVSMFLTPFAGLFVPTFRSLMSKLLDFWNPWGTKMVRNGLRFNTFAHKGCKIAASKKVFTDFCIGSLR